MTVLLEPDTRAGQPLRAVRPWTIALLFGVVATALCAAFSWVPSLWGDEAATLLSAKRSVGSLFGMLFHVDAVHGLYYLVMHGWIRLAGDSAFALRLPSAVAVGAAVAAVTLIAGRRGGLRAAVVSGVVASVLPRLTYAGEEARSYAFSAAAAAWLTLLLLWLVDGGGRRLSPAARRLAWVLYGAGMAAMSYLFLYSITLLVAHGAVLLASRASRATVRAWALSSAAAVVAVSPLAVLAYLERSQIKYLGETPDDPSIWYYFLWFGMPWVAIAAWALIGFGLWPAWRARRLRASRPVFPGPRAISTRLVASAWLFLPTGAMLLANAAYPMYTGRYSTFAAPAAALLVAEGILVLGRLIGGDARRTVAATAGVTIVFALLCAPVYALQRGPYAKNDSDWAEVSAAMAANAGRGDAVVFDESAKPSQRPRLAMRTYPAGFRGVKDPTLRVPYYRNDGWADRAYSVTQAAQRGRFDGVDRVWLIELEVVTPDGRSTVEDTWGLADLHALGFAETGRRLDTHRSDIIELTR
ncbi:glycosyltransferase family 39 protein [Leifsonia sp. fls2-241-R2A-40a]|uniref:glycosyltransferase family 39 protein n=1 Tax=Leifsonia sp. fls2-241-R2A-40a TaxID=3040290 RepID=UPI00254D8069|nr:glycosyltransferase family 39 protein [Leifsonia sp. fls2-241-R2A-40a]